MLFQILSQAHRVRIADCVGFFFYQGYVGHRTSAGHIDHPAKEQLRDQNFEVNPAVIYSSTEPTLGETLLNLRLIRQDYENSIKENNLCWQGVVARLIAANELLSKKNQQLQHDLAICRKALLDVDAELFQSKFLLQTIEHVADGYEADDFELSFPLIKKISEGSF